MGKRINVKVKALETQEIQEEECEQVQPLSAEQVQEQEQEQKKEAEQERFMNKCLMFIAKTTIIFMVLQYISFLVVGEEQDTLIQSYFTAVVIEIGGLLIKRIIEKRHEKNENSEGE